MDPQMMATALMGGQNNMQPSQTMQQPDPTQFNPQALGYGQSPQMRQGMGQGMFSPPPYGAVAQQNMLPPNMMGY